MAKNSIITVDAVEELVDSCDHGVMNLMIAIELMAAEKAEHIRVNWQDQKTAAVWDRLSKRARTMVRWAAKEGI